MNLPKMSLSREKNIHLKNIHLNQIISHIIHQLESHGFKIHKPAKDIQYGIQLTISREDNPTRTSLLNIYFGKKGITINLQGEKNDNLKKIIHKLNHEINTIFYNKKTQAPSRTITTKYIIGSDESGKGDYFGPLVIAAFLSDPETDQKLIELGVKDSKKISDSRCLELSMHLKNLYGNTNKTSIKKFSILCVTPSEYNRLYLLEKQSNGNLNTLLKKLHLKNISHLIKNSRSELKEEKLSIIIDDFTGGKHPATHTSAINQPSLFPTTPVESTPNSYQEDEQTIIYLNSITDESIHYIQQSEDKYPSVAAASILARATYLEELHHISSRYLKGTGLKLLPGSGTEISILRKKIISLLGSDILPHIAKTSFNLI